MLEALVYCTVSPLTEEEKAEDSHMALLQHATLRRSDPALRSGLTSVIVLTLALGASTTARAQSWHPPSEEERCPSKWGAGDERGSGNHMSPQTVLRAARLAEIKPRCHT